MNRRWWLLLVVLACACGHRQVTTAPAPATTERVVSLSPPAVPAGPLAASVVTALESLATAPVGERPDRTALDVVAASGDARVAWFLADLLRFVADQRGERVIVDAFTRLTGAPPQDDPEFQRSAWVRITDQLIAWDLPAPPDYRRFKAELFEQVEPEWKPFFSDTDADIDWRLLSWGGVYIDNRPAGDRGPCLRGCIPSLDDPALTDAAGGSWYPDEDVVFAVVVGGEAVAFPKNIMEVHEMVNVTIGSRRVGMPYCTLCASAQAYLTDSVPGGIDIPVLRTSGLLSRSNKVMYDQVTRSVFDTFTGRAVSGPLQDAQVELEQIAVVTSTWGEWKAAHPDTRIVAEDGGIGVSYERDPLGGRDDAGPIFPVGPVDPRLPVQAKVLGVIAPDGTPVAFEVQQATTALQQGVDVTAAGVEVFTDAGGLRARSDRGEEPAHEAFWFAWSQFNPQTLLWTPPQE